MAFDVGVFDLRPWQKLEALEVERILKENIMGSNEVNNVEVCNCNNPDCSYPEGTYYDDKVAGGVVCVDDCIHEFNEKFKFYERMDTEQRITHAMRLIKEEAKEVVEALGDYGVPYTDPDAKINEIDRLNDKANLIKELCDLEYVMSQAILLLGLEDYMCEAFKEVHRSNMSKVSENGEPIFDKKGKVLKGPNYSPADIHSVIKKVDEFYAEVK